MILHNEKLRGTAPNRYAYVGNNPVLYVDPSGECRGLSGAAFDTCVAVVMATASSVHKANAYGQDIFFPDANTTFANRLEASTAIGGGAVLLAAGSVEIVGALAFGGGPLWTAATGGGSACSAACADGDCTNELGKLKSVGQNAWQSTAGLRYGADRRFTNRVQHILRHTVDNINRAGYHGVFSTGRSGTLRIIDEAWRIAQQGGPNVSIIQQGPRTIYTINMGRQIGYIGGQVGAAAGNLPASHIRLVVEGVNEIITAYPVVP